jgi:hypothetical protein
MCKFKIASLRVDVQQLGREADEYDLVAYSERLSEVLDNEGILHDLRFEPSRERAWFGLEAPSNRDYKVSEDYEAAQLALEDRYFRLSEEVFDSQIWVERANVARALAVADEAE